MDGCTFLMTCFVMGDASNFQKDLFHCTPNQVFFVVWLKMFPVSWIIFTFLQKIDIIAKQGDFFLRFLTVHPVTILGK